MHPIGFLQKQLICRWCTHHLPSRKHNQVVTLLLKQLCQHLNRQPISACHKEVLTTLQNQSPKLQSCRCCTFCRRFSAVFVLLHIIHNIKYSFLFVPLVCLILFGIASMLCHVDHLTPIYMCNSSLLQSAPMFQKGNTFCVKE